MRSAFLTALPVSEKPQIPIAAKFLGIVHPLSKEDAMYF